MFASENAKLKKEDIFVLPLDVLDFSSHESAVENVLKYFKRVSDILCCYVKKDGARFKKKNETRPFGNGQTELL